MPQIPRQAACAPIEELLAPRADVRSSGRSRHGGSAPLVFARGPQGPALAGRARFPAPIALAASWDEGLLREVYANIAQDLRALGCRLLLGPSLAVARDPRQCDVQASFGEDPCLVAELGVAAIGGLQGGPASTPLAAGKVLAAPGPWGSGSAAAREWHDVHRAPFAAAIARCGLAALVPSRQANDGLPALADAPLLGEQLRDREGFAGAILAEPGAIAELHSHHAVAASLGDAACLALEAGVDVDLSPDPVRALPAGTPRRADEALQRLHALQARAGLPGTAAGDGPASAADARLALARRAAQAGVVLLKNDGVLPLALSTTRHRRLPRIAVLAGGPLLAGLREAVHGRAVVVAARGIAAARGADHVVLGVAGEPVRALARAERRLAALQALGLPVVVVLATERPAASVPLAEQAAALVAAWGLGSQCGRAVADILLGKVNPGGKLPLSLARHEGQLPVFYNAKPSARRGYLFEANTPLFAFGWGLTYSRFELGAPRLSAATMSPTASVRVSVDLRNIGQRAGDQVVQLYVRDRLASVTRPLLALKRFQRVTLGAGETRRLHFQVDAACLALCNTDLQWVVEPGEFEIMVGLDSTDLQSTTLTVIAAPTP